MSIVDVAGNLTGSIAQKFIFNMSEGSVLNGTNMTAGLAYDQTPEALQKYLLIFRLVLLGIGTLDTLLLLFVYLKCTSIINGSLGVYVVNISIAALFDFIDVAIWAVRQFGYKLDDVPDLPWWVYKLPELPAFAMPTISLFMLMLIVDRFFATCFAGCHRACYGSRITAVFVSIALWVGGFFLTFILAYPDLLFPDSKLHELLRFLITYIGPASLKLLLILILFAKRRIVPDNEQSQAFIHRQRESLYYVLTILTLHFILSLPYYLLQANIYFPLTAINFDEWVMVLAYALSQVPIVLNPIICLSIEADFRDSLVFVCTCSGRTRRELTDLCDDHAESQPLAPLATSPITEEKEHLGEAEN